MALSNIYTFPEQATLIEAATERSREIDANSIASQLLPISVEDTDQCYWEILDNVQGLTPVVGPDQPYPVTRELGSRRFTVPFVRFGEQRIIPADRLTRSRELGSFDRPFALDAIISQGLTDLAIKEAQTVDFLRWRLLSAGTVSVTDASGALQVVATVDGYAANNITAVGVPWATVATATPIANFKALRDARAGFGFDFGRTAMAYANSRTWNNLFNNTNQADLGGRRQAGLATINGIDQYNAFVSAGENVPMLVAVDDGFINANGAFERYIPDNTVIVVGRHWQVGLAVGNYVVGRHEALSGGPGIYAAAGLNTSTAPPVPWYARGHRGNVRMTYQRQVAVLTTA
ncbi:hypothetical protein [Microcystis phage Mae-JY24]